MLSHIQVCRFCGSADGPLQNANSNASPASSAPADQSGRRLSERVEHALRVAVGAAAARAIAGSAAPAAHGSRFVIRHAALTCVANARRAPALPCARA
ncbi:hypothetical protein EVAR_103359_1 [Eumeta japonica]|uniref:Uncharacterized protein n=1 Tax=Eumeta variegata TaxID=151549 RepID=A0A4C1Y968_EUMVA|nr:hypothetical protein EVAR_103359_1 [Eumeta japonica]